MYNYFVAEVEKFNMRILNPPELRRIDTFYTKNDYPKWKYWFEGLIRLRGRLFVVFLTPPYWMYVIESLYDAGMRTGDSFFLSNGRVAYSIMWETNLLERLKLIDLIYGWIVVSQAEWFGDYGEMIKDGYVKKYGNETDFRCLAFDAAILLLNGIKFTVQQGQDVKNYLVMKSNLRKQKFLGCFGTVSIEPGTNQRSLPTIGIHYLKWDEYSRRFYEELVGKYDYSSAQLITFYKSVIWYDNTTSVPTDMLTYENGCPFPAKIIFRSEKGAGVDALQFISQGPDISKMDKWLSVLCSYSLMSFDSSVAGYAYWYYLYTAIGISSYSILSIFLVLSRLNKLLEKLLNHARSLALLLLPIIGNIIFVPMVLVLLSIFQCDQGIGQEITDSFIRHDCTNYCWDNKYVLPGVLSIISLGSYIPSAIYFRIYYENCNVYINIKMKPIFLIEKSICQVVMISMNKTVKFYDESLHGLCCIIIFAIFIALCFKQNPYNYYKWIFGWLFHISQFRGALLYHLSIGSQILIIYLYDIYFNIQYSLF